MNEYVREIKKILSTIELEPNNLSSLHGTLIEKICTGVEKYSCTSDIFSHFIVFSEDGVISEISITLKDELNYDQEFIDNFGALNFNYSFRDNITVFKFITIDKNVSINIIKDNKFELQEDNTLLEIKPNGGATRHEYLLFNSINFIINNKKSNLP